MRTGVPDMTLVPDDQVAIVRERIAVIEEYERHRAAHGGSMAHSGRMARRLGVCREQLHYLSQKWRNYGRPEHLLARLPGRAAPHPLRPDTPPRPLPPRGLPTETMMMTLTFEERRQAARRLRQARRRAGYVTRQEANARFGWNATDCRDHEVGNYLGPRALAAYAQAYGVTTGQLLGEVPMELDPTIGRRVADLVFRSRATQAELAAAGGWSAAGSMTRHAQPEYDPDLLPVNAGEKLAMALVGRGSPPISRDEIMMMCEHHPRTDRRTLVAASVPRRASMPVDRARVAATAASAQPAGVSHIDLSLLRPADQLAMMTLYQSLLQNASVATRPGH